MRKHLYRNFPRILAPPIGGDNTSPTMPNYRVVLNGSKLLAADWRLPSALWLPHDAVRRGRQPGDRRTDGRSIAANRWEIARDYERANRFTDDLS